MASKQFVLEMHKKLHPDSDINRIDYLTGAELDAITKIIDDKHSIILGSPWIPDDAKVNLRVLRNVMTSASLQCHDKLNELNAKTVGSMTDGDGHVWPATVADWEASVAYYQDQLDTIKIIEDQLLEPLLEATHEDGFYMQGVEVRS